MGPRADLDGRKILSLLDSIPDRPARSSVTILTELPGPHFTLYTYLIIIICLNVGKGREYMHLFLPRSNTYYRVIHLNAGRNFQIIIRVPRAEKYREL